METFPEPPAQNQGSLAATSAMFHLRTVRQKFLYDGRLASALSRLDQGRVAGPVEFLKVDGNTFVQEAPDLSEIAICGGDYQIFPVAATGIGRRHGDVISEDWRTDCLAPAQAALPGVR